MHYLISVIENEESLSAQIDDAARAAEATAVDEFNDRLRAEGNWVFAGALGSARTATAVDNRRDASFVGDGPFVESKEFLGGFWIVQAEDRDTALRLAREGSKACNRRVELWPVLQE